MNPAIKINAKESDYLYIKQSQIHNAGLGLFTAITIYKDEIISFFKGDILSQKESAKRSSAGENGYFIKMVDGGIMDSMHTKCFAKYANDPQGATKSKLKINANICLDENGKVCLVANKVIKSGAEILCGYGKKYWTNYSKMLNK